MIIGTSNSRRASSFDPFLHESTAAHRIEDLPDPEEIIHDILTSINQPEAEILRSCSLKSRQSKYFCQLCAESKLARDGARRYFFHGSVILSHSFRFVKALAYLIAD